MNPFICPRKVIIPLVLFLVLAGMVGPIQAQSNQPVGIGTLEVTPAATLLLPYFEVDLADANGVNTVFTVRNSSPDEVVAHITLWTDLAWPSLDFDIHLEGYDSQAVNLYDLFVNGNLPVTGTAMSPGAFPACTAFFPFVNPALNAALLSRVQTAHSGQPVPQLGGSCAGFDHGDGLARGYVTIDVITDCTILFPNDAGYYSGPLGFENVLWGDYVLIDRNNNTAVADNLVHIEASLTDPLTTTPGNYTFYGRYVNENASDRREPLPLAWGIPFDNGGVWAGQGTELVVWRDPGQEPTNWNNGFTCGAVPSPFPLNHNTSTEYDANGSPLALPTDQLDFATQRVRLDLGVTTSISGFLQLDLNTSNSGVFDPFKQSFVTSINTAPGLYQASTPGMQLQAIDMANLDGALGRAQHSVSDNWLGTAVTTEFIPGGDSNDGVTRHPSDQWQPGNTVRITTTVSGSGFLAGWLDWNNNSDVSDVGDFVISQTVSSGDNLISFAVPAGYVAGTTIQARFRLYDVQPTAVSATGPGVGGEVEDYTWLFNPLAVNLLPIKVSTTESLPWLLMLFASSVAFIFWKRGKS